MWYCLYCCHCQCESSFKETCTSFFRVFSLPLYPYPLMSRNARNDEVGEIVKIANKALHCLAGEIDNFANFATNQQVNANNKKRRPPLRVSNMANLTNMVHFANKVNLANVANSLTSPATNKSMQMTRQDGPFANGKHCEFYERDRICQICQQARV